MTARYRIVVDFGTDRPLTHDEWDRLLGAVEVQVSEPAPLTIEERRAGYEVTTYTLVGVES